MKVETEHVNLFFVIRLRAKVGGKDNVVKKLSGKDKSGKKIRGKAVIHMVLTAE